MPVISIIIPVYNVEKYLRRCLDSCINQTFKDIEIIVVNDASPDNSELIMREYEERYSELVHCIYLSKNRCLGGARNCGISAAHGDYIMFVDSDDWIHEEMCQLLYHSALMNNADIVISNAYEIDDNEMKIYKLTDYSCDSMNVDNKLLLKSVVACSRIYKRKFLLETSVFFPENVYYEDEAVVPLWLLRANVINTIVQPLYYYFRHSDSITRGNVNVRKRIQFPKNILYFIKHLSIVQPYYYECAIKHVFKKVLDIIIEFTIFYYEYEKTSLDFFKKGIIEELPDVTNIIEYVSSDKIEANIIKQFLTIPGYIELLNNSNRIKTLSKFCLWGYGHYGKMVYHYLKNNGVKPICIIDNNSNIITDFDNTPISGYCESEFCYENVIIAVKNRLLYEEIRNQIHRSHPNVNVIWFYELFIIGYDSD